PGAELVSLAQKPQVLPGGDERFLRQVLTFAEAAGGAVSQRTNQRLVARNDLLESIAVTVESLRHQFRVGRCFACHHSVHNHITVSVPEKRLEVTRKLVGRISCSDCRGSALQEAAWSVSRVQRTGDGAVCQKPEAMKTFERPDLLHLESARGSERCRFAF